MDARAQLLRSLIIDVPDFPTPGVLFRDISPLLGDGEGFARSIEALAEFVEASGATKVAAMEARGFLLGAPVAFALGIGFVPIRKPNKLPRASNEAVYALEYGQDRLAIHADAAVAGDRVAIVDDVLATGGTAAAAVNLVEGVGAEVAGLVFLLEIEVLGGRALIEGHCVDAVLAL